MEKNDRQILLEPFGYAKFLGVSFVSFIGLLSGYALLCEFSEPLDKGKAIIAAEPIALPALFSIFVTGHLLLEILKREQRLRIERLRSSPKFPRHVARQNLPLTEPANDDQN